MVRGAEAPRYVLATLMCDAVQDPQPRLGSEPDEGAPVQCGRAGGDAAREDGDHEVRRPAHAAIAADDLDFLPETNPNALRSALAGPPQFDAEPPCADEAVWARDSRHEDALKRCCPARGKRPSLHHRGATLVRHRAQVHGMSSQYFEVFNARLPLPACASIVEAHPRLREGQGMPGLLREVQQSPRLRRSSQVSRTCR